MLPVPRFEISKDSERGEADFHICDQSPKCPNYLFGILPDSINAHPFKILKVSTVAILHIEEVELAIQSVFHLPNQTCVRPENEIIFSGLGDSTKAPHREFLDFEAKRLDHTVGLHREPEE